METVQLPDAKIYDTQRLMHSATSTNNVDLAQ